jgi:uncharacterized FlaG/YvyC family protein
MELTPVHPNLQSSLTAPADAARSAPAAEDRRALIRAVRAVNSADLFGYDRELSFAFDRSSQRPVVRIVNRETRELIQQIPAEYILRMAEELNRS